MQLFLVDKPGCHHITELMPGIKAVYQLEQEFDPYLLVEFLPNQNKEYSETGGVLIIAGGEKIWRPYRFDKESEKKKELEDLRRLLWGLLRKYHNPVDIADKDGCIKDFRKTQTNRVIMGWANKKRLMSKNRCCKMPNKKKDLVSKKVLHWSYRDTADPYKGENLETCKKIRWQECGDNYPPNTPDFKRCCDEVATLCGEYHRRGNKKELMDRFVSATHRDLIRKVDKNGGLIDKKLFDDLVDTGMVNCFAGGACKGCKACGVNKSVEGFDDTDTSNLPVLLLLIIIVIILYFCVNGCKN